MNTAERIAKVRELTPFDFMNGANYVLVQQLCDELEKAQKRIAFLEEAVEAHQNHIDELQAVVERVNKRIADLSHNENILIPAEKYELDVLRRLAPLKPNYAQMVTDDEEALEDA